MDYNRELAGKGLYYVFWGVIACEAGSLLSLVPIVGGLLSIIGVACTIYGYLTAAKSDTGYMNAVFCAGGMLVVAVIDVLTGLLFNSLLSAIIVALSLAAVYFMCQTTGQLLESTHPDLTIRARMLWKLYLVCTVVRVVCLILSAIPLIGLLAGALGWVVSIVGLIASILYMVFLYKAQKALRGLA